MSTLHFSDGKIILEDRVLPDGSVTVDDSRITAVHSSTTRPPAGARFINLEGGYLAPGFVDLHVHGGAGADFMDGTVEAFRTVCQAHARHGTTSLLATTTVARHEQHISFLETCRRLKAEGTGGSAILGAHFYGPYFAPEARGCHPGGSVRPPSPSEYAAYLDYAD